MALPASMTSWKVTRFGAPLEEVVEPVRPPRGREVLLRVAACGVCHSDVHLADGYFDLGGGRRMDLGRTLGLPRTLGHEIAGEVVAVGEAVTEVAVGMRRLVYPWIGCGDCPLCRRGDEYLCARSRTLGIARDGGFGDHVTVPDARYLVDFGDVPAEVACTWACSGLTAYGALRKAGPVNADAPLLVMGAGGVGQSAIRLCTAIHDAAASVADVDAAKREAARAAGAAHVADPADPQAGKRLLEATGGGFASVIDFVGTPQTVEFGMAVLRKGGTLVVVGLFGGAIELAIPMLPLRAIALAGSYVGSLADLQALAALGRAGRMPPIPVARRALSEAQAVLDELRAGRVAGRAVLQPPEPAA